MPKPQLEQAVLLIEGFRAGAEGLLTPDAARLADLDADGVLAQVSAAIAQDVMSAFDALLALLRSDDYVAAAPEAVRSEEHTSELQLLICPWYAVLCLNK